MIKEDQNFHICDDWISFEVGGLRQIHSLCDALRLSTNWIEVVGGLNSIAVQFDPRIMNPEQAAFLFKQQISQPIDEQARALEIVELPACYDPAFAPDLVKVSETLNIPQKSVADWHSQLKFTVAMLGFMPGFAYLQCNLDIPEIGRLSHPRKNIAAGSIGVIGDQNCIYSFDTPGGWPIIGRIAAKLFTPTNNPASLLSAGQEVRFIPIDRNGYENLK